MIIFVIGAFVIFEGSVLIFVDVNGELKDIRMLGSLLTALLLYVSFVWILNMSWSKKKDFKLEKLERTVIVLIISLMKKELNEKFYKKDYFYVVKHFFKAYNNEDLERVYNEIVKYDFYDIPKVCNFIKKYPSKVKIYVINILLVIASGDKFITLNEKSFIRDIKNRLEVNDKNFTYYYNLQIKKGIREEQEQIFIPSIYTDNRKLKKAYETLGLKETDKFFRVKKKYRKLAKKYHPDTNENPDDAHSFLKISEAYKIIKEIKK